MALLKTNLIQEQTGRPTSGLGRAILSPSNRDATIQWLVVGVVGVALGTLVLGVSSLPLRLLPLVLVAALCPFAALVVKDVRRLLLAVIVLDIPFKLDVNVALRPEAALIGSIEGYNISATTISLVALYAIWLVQTLARIEQPPRLSFRESLPLAFYVLVATLSIFVAADPTFANFEVFLLVQMFLMYIYVVSTTRTREDVIFIVTMILVALALESVIIMSGGRINLPGLSSRVDVRGESSRFGGTIGSPNTAAAYLSLMLAPALSVLLTRLGRWHKMLAVVAFGAGAIALILTFSRGGWAAFLVSMVILGLLAWYRGWLSLGIPFLVGFLVLIAAFVFQDTILGRLVADDRGSAASRIPLIEIAWRMVQDHPVLGVGANNFGTMLKHYVTPEFSQEWIFTVHNKYFLVWSEVGFAGLLAFLWFLLTTLKRGLQKWRIDDRILAPLAYGFAAGIMGQMIHMFVDIFHSRPQVQSLWFVAALLAAMRNIDTESSQKSDVRNQKSEKSIPEFYRTS